MYEAQGAKGALDHGIKPIDPSLRLAGSAYTADCRPADKLMLHGAMQKARPGDVLVGDRDGIVVVPQAEVGSATATSLAREA